MRPYAARPPRKTAFLPPLRRRRLAASCAYLSHLRRGCVILARNRYAEASMDGLATVDAAGVLAPINFTQPMAEKPYSYNYEPPPGVPVRNTREETHTVKIVDARPFNDVLSLDREGFVLLSRPT